MMNVTYLTVTISVIAQKISEMTPKTCLARRLEAVLGREDGPQRVERAGADVAEDDADGAEDDRGLVSGVLTRGSTYASVRPRRIA